jgi:hypothetical protein
MSHSRRLSPKSVFLNKRNIPRVRGIKGNAKKPLQSLEKYRKYKEAKNIANPSAKNKKIVTFEASYTLKNSFIQMYPTNVRPAIVIPSINIIIIEK